MTRSKPSRRLPLAPGARVGVTEAMIRYVVTAFYARVSMDPLLSPIFERALGADWGPHLDRMCDFWSSVLLLTGRFKGAPMQAHTKLPGVNQFHFDRWQHLFRRTASEICPAPAAALFIQKADMIGRTLFAVITAKRSAILFDSRPGAGPLH